MKWRNVNLRGLSVEICKQAKRPVLYSNEMMDSPLKEMIVLVSIDSVPKIMRFRTDFSDEIEPEALISDEIRHQKIQARFTFEYCSSHGLQGFPTTLPSRLCRLALCAKLSLDSLCY